MRKTRGWIRWAAVAAMAACVGSAPAWAARNWTLVDIGTLGGPGSYGTAVSNNGLVVGCSDVAGGAVHAFLYRDGTLHDLGTANGAGDGNSCALAVNSDGVAAGRSGTGELVVWKDASVTNLGVRGEVGGINEAGVVVGRYVDGTRSGAFMYRDGMLSDLGVLGGNLADPYAYSAATGVNVRNEVVGSSNGRAFLYVNGAMRDLGTLGGNQSAARGINDRGQVVGMAANAQGQPTAFLYDGAMRALPGWDYATAIDISNRAQVIASDEGAHGYLVADGKATRLDQLPDVASRGWHHLEPKGINDRGWIVGTAFNAEGQSRAFLLIPR